MMPFFSFNKSMEGGIVFNKYAIPKYRALLYFFVFFLIGFWHFIYLYGSSDFYQVLSILSTALADFSVAQRQDLMFDFFYSLFIFPFFSTLFLFIFEKIYFNKLNKYGIIFFSLPIILLLGGILGIWHSIDLLAYYPELWFFSLVLLVHLPIIITQWKQSILYFLGISLIFLADFIHRNFGDITADQLFSTLTLGSRGLLTVSPDLLVSFIKFVIVIPLMISGLILNIQKWIVKRTYLSFKFIIYFPIQLLLICIGVFCLENTTNLFVAVKNYYKTPENTEDLFAKKYVDPRQIKFTTTEPKSLIFIYVESLESSYQNGELFGRNLLASLTYLKQQAISFQQYKQAIGSQWTTAGIIASQCGIPLRLITVFNGNNLGENVNQFLPGAVCLSDVLEKLGYRNIFMKGASLLFSGQGNFMKTHHYDEAFGKEEWLKRGFNSFDMIGWGLPDDLLFQQAKSKVEQLVKNKKPFNLTILTVDTHGPHGQMNKTCYAQGARNFADIVECTANEVADFINYIESRGWLDKMVIVVTGDHLAMGNQLSDKLKTSASRSIFNRLITQDLLKKNRETIFHVDLFPTILNALGIQWPGNQLALGYSAIDPLKPSISSEDQLNIIEHTATFPSALYNTLWTSRGTS